MFGCEAAGARQDNVLKSTWLHTAFQFPKCVAVLQRDAKGLVGFGERLSGGGETSEKDI